MLLTALSRALAALPTPPLRRVLALGFGLSAVTFALLWAVLATVVFPTAVFSWRPLNWLLDLTGGLAVLVVSWLLFPAVITLIMGFLGDRVAATVEATDYPGLGPPRRQTWREIVLWPLRLTVATFVLNLLALPLYYSFRV
jgi:hypothetical protein